MKRLKPVFITLAATFWTGFTYLFIAAIVDSIPAYAIAGLGLLSVLPFGFFAILLIFKPTSRTSTHLTIITSFMVLGLAISLYSFNENILSTAILLMAVGSLALWLIYLNWYSVIPRNQSEPVVGDYLPELSFLENNNSELSTRDLQGRKMLMMFYRGNWCPLCMAQIKEISAQYKELEKRGIETLLISPQPSNHSASLAKKMNVNFRFVTDKDNRMAQKLNIDHKYGTPLGMQIFGYKTETVMPTVIIADGSGKIMFVDQTDNYRVRPEPSTFLAILDAENE